MFRTSIIFIVLALVGFFFQGTMIRNSCPTAPVPDVIAILVVIIALRYWSVWGLIGCFLVGLLADLASGHLLGLNAAGAIVAFAFAGFVSARVYADRFPAIMLIALFCSLVKTATCLAILFFLTSRHGFEHALFTSESAVMILAESVWNAVLTPFLLRGLYGKSGTSLGAFAHGTESFRWAEKGRPQ